MSAGKFYRSDAIHSGADMAKMLEDIVGHSRIFMRSPRVMAGQSIRRMHGTPVIPRDQETCKALDPHGAAP